MTTFKRKKFLLNAVSSLQNQSYKKLEIIVSQDKNKDDEIENIIRSIQENDSRVVFYRQKKQLYMNGNFKFTLSKANGEFFCWASDDDNWDVKYIEKLVDLLIGDSTIIHASSKTKLINERNEVVDYLDYDFDYNIPSTKIRYKKYLDNLLKTNYPFYGLFRTEALRKIQLKNYIGSDQAFMGSVIASGKSVQLDEYLFQYRKDGDSLNAKSYLNAIGLKKSSFNQYLFAYKFLLLIILCPFNSYSISFFEKIQLCIISCYRICNNTNHKVWLKRQLLSYYKAIVRPSLLKVWKRLKLLISE